MVGLIRVIAMSFCLFAKYIYVGEYFAIVNNGGRLKSSPLIICHCSNCCPCGKKCDDNLFGFNIPLQSYYIYTYILYSISFVLLWLKLPFCKAFVTISKQISVKYFSLEL